MQTARPCGRAVVQFKGAFSDYRIASFAALATRNFSTFLAGI